MNSYDKKHSSSPSFSFAHLWMFFNVIIHNFIVGESKETTPIITSAYPLYDPNQKFCAQQTKIDQPFEDYPHTVAMTPWVNKNLIQYFILGSPAECGKMTDLIDTACQIHPVIKDYIEIAFTHLPGFQIIPVLQKDIMSHIQTNYGAYYYPVAKTLYFPIDSTDPVPLTLHEFHHVAKHAICSTLLNKRVVDTLATCEPDYPDNNKKIRQYLGSGDNEVAKLKENLISSGQGKLKKKEQQKLTQLREKLTPFYTAHYVFNVSAIIPKEQVPHVEKRFGPLKPGVVLPPNPENGPLKIEQIEKRPDKSYEMITVYLDPLHAIVYKILSNSVKENYHEEDYVFEREAFLYQYLHPSIIKHFYLKLYNRGVNLLQQALKIPVNFEKPKLRYLSLKSVNQLKQQGFFRKLPQGLNNEIADEFLCQAREYSKDKNHLAVSLLNMIIKNPAYITEARILKEAETLLKEITFTPARVLPRPQ